MGDDERSHARNDSILDPRSSILDPRSLFSGTKFECGLARSGEGGLRVIALAVIGGSGDAQSGHGPNFMGDPFSALWGVTLPRAKAGRHTAVRQWRFKACSTPCHSHPRTVKHSGSTGVPAEGSSRWADMDSEDQASLISFSFS
jgi:hypothetical protein